jgi:hypothetical protein
MEMHEEKNCPRCQNFFECNVGSILICQCTTVTLNEAERDDIMDKYDDCLCANCMLEMRADYHNSI